MNQEAGSEDARLACLDEGVGGPIQNARRLAGARRRDAKPLEERRCSGGEPAASGNAGERSQRKVSSLKRPVLGKAGIALAGLVPA